MAWQLRALTFASAVGQAALDGVPHHISLVQVASHKYGKHDLVVLELDPMSTLSWPCTQHVIRVQAARLIWTSICRP